MKYLILFLLISCQSEIPTKEEPEPKIEWCREIYVTNIQKLDTATKELVNFEREDSIKAINCNDLPPMPIKPKRIYFDSMKKECEYYCQYFPEKSYNLTFKTASNLVLFCIELEEPPK